MKKVDPGYPMLVLKGITIIPDDGLEEKLLKSSPAFETRHSSLSALAQRWRRTQGDPTKIKIGIWSKKDTH